MVTVRSAEIEPGNIKKANWIKRFLYIFQSSDIVLEYPDRHNSDDLLEYFKPFAA